MIYLHWPSFHKNLGFAFGCGIICLTQLIRDFFLADFQDWIALGFEYWWVVSLLNSLLPKIITLMSPNTPSLIQPTSIQILEQSNLESQPKKKKK